MVHANISVNDDDDHFERAPEMIEATNHRDDDFEKALDLEDTSQKGGKEGEKAPTVSA